MPFSSKEKVAHYRARVNSDPAARASYLAKRKESYQRRKRQGKTQTTPVAELPKSKQELAREKWKEYQRTYREKKRKLALNLTPLRDEDMQLDNPEPVDRPKASSTPTSKEGGKKERGRSRERNRSEKHHKAILKQRDRLRSELRKVKKELEAHKKRVRRMERKPNENKQKGGRKRNKVTRKNASHVKKEEVTNFLCRDENSRILPGKKDTVTHKKNKCQRRVLLHSLKDLHTMYNLAVVKHLRLSYRQFVRYCPFYVTPAKEGDRNTCACFDHENVKLLIDSLYKKGLLLMTSTSELLALITCDTNNKQCMYRTCPNCCYDEIVFEGPMEAAKLTWQQWHRIVTNIDGKNFSNFAKVSESGTCQELLTLFNQKLDAVAKHQFNWLHQTRAVRELKETLRENEVCLHIDFSENYGCKLNTEVQAFHFGGSRKQVTIHTCVAYTASSQFSYATLSASPRHDERAVWAHIEPVLKDVIGKCTTLPTSLHIISDGPVTQYRNKKNFYLLSTVPFMTGFTSVTWNFSEKAHGKGAPDGVGGAVKRTADTAVQRGTDIQTPEELFSYMKDQPSSIAYHWIPEEAIEKYDELVPSNVPAVKGTMKLHQVMSVEPAAIQWRDISCFCTRPVTCKCYNPATVDFRNLHLTLSTSPQALPSTSSTSPQALPSTSSTSPQALPSTSSTSPQALPSTLSTSPQDLKGKFIVVRYESKPFVGQVVQVVNEEVEVSCMQQLGGKNVFTWPHPPDLLFYYQSDVLLTVSEPEPLNTRHSKITVDDWKHFQTHCNA